jgi:hypothetical protein
MTDLTHKSWLSTTKSALEKTWYEPVFIAKLIAQLEKDLYPFEIRDVYTNTLSKEEIILKLTENIRSILITIEKSSPDAIPQVLYKIDLPQSIFEEIYKNADDINTSLAESILIREAYKVWMRSQY